MTPLQATLIFLILVTGRIILPALLTITFGKLIDRYSGDRHLFQR